MIALRPLAISVLAFSFTACSIDKSSSQAPQPLENPPAKEVKKTAPTPMPPPEPQNKENSGSPDAIPMTSAEAFTDRVWSGDFDSTEPATRMASPVKGYVNSLKRKLLNRLNLVKTDGEQKFLAALAENDLLVYMRFAGAGQNGGLFHQLTAGDRTRLVRALLDAGVTQNIDIQDRQGQTPLYSAQSDEMVELLFPYNSPWVRDHAGRTPLLFMLWASSPPWRLMLQKNCEYGWIFGSLFDHSPINATDSGGQAAIHYSARDGNLVVLNTILDCPRAKIFIRDGQGKTPLHIAAASMRKAVLTTNLLLLAARARITPLSAFVDAQDAAGDTALHIAQRCENKELMDLLIYFGARTDLKNAHGLTALEQKSYDCPAE